MATVEIDDFYALRTGAARQRDGKPATLTVQPLGLLRVPSGRLGACDPFVSLGSPVVLPIPPGVYPVSVTVADVSPEQDGSHHREAYLSVILADGDPVTAAAAHADGAGLEPEQFWLVAVDAGTVAFVDADAVATCMPDDEGAWYEEVFDDGTDQSWFSQVDAAEPLPAGAANVVLPHASAGENVVLAHSGWGDGYYPLIATFSAEGQMLAIHLDLLVVGPADLDAEQPASEAGPRPVDPAHDPPAGFTAKVFSQIFGRQVVPPQVAPAAQAKAPLPVFIWWPGAPLTAPWGLRGRRRPQRPARVRRGRRGRRTWPGRSGSGLEG